ncbi:STAS/SEC14 domain-containing protein [Paenarthrobacter sp. CM16]|uniref:DUF7793 family protein n=1 Tax=Paenarthrobacter sp. CM16 TaxID=2738447 RepID=UPI0015533D6D|nr:STAS/SEC14 domain-containing protein [Paenarthrobacter sp. CM16]NQD90591.1 STAS/SEC14 domain-containing protein [Paenarthrobacter sp. CM16]
MTGQDQLPNSAVRLEGEAILHLMWNPGTHIEAENAQAAMDAVNSAAGTERYPLLVEIAEASFLSHEARAVFAQPCSASRIALLGAGPVDRVLVDYQLNTAAPPCSTRFFSSKADALTWLREPQ